MVHFQASPFPIVQQHRQSGLMTKRVVVLGAGGFVGSHLCGRLMDGGQEVVGLGRSEKPASIQGVDWVRGDFADRVLLRRTLEGCAVAVHLVSTTTPAASNVDPLGDLQSNLAGTLAFLEEARLAQVGLIIFVSSGGTVYGVPDVEAVPETMLSNPLCAYGITKFAAEQYLELYKHLHGIEYCVLRISNIFGERQKVRQQQGVMAAFMGAAARGQPLEIWGDGSVVRDYLYVSDAVGAIVRAMEMPASAHRVFNVGSGIGRSIRDLVADVQEVSGRPLNVSYRPGRKVDVPRIVLDITRARTVLGWEPVEMWRNALQKTYRWYAKNA